MNLYLRKGRGKEKGTVHEGREKRDASHSTGREMEVLAMLGRENEVPCGELKMGCIQYGERHERGVGEWVRPTAEGRNGEEWEGSLSKGGE